MRIKRAGNKAAMIVLHEIYGVNNFIEDVCVDYHARGFDVYCPDIFEGTHEGTHFPYSEDLSAYQRFLKSGGFDFYMEIERLLEQIRDQYNQIFILGFSVGATVAWRCCENEKCDGIICCYGSRIRDYPELLPVCPVLLLFASRDSFDVNGALSRLREKANTKAYSLEAEHGFMDPFSPRFDSAQAQKANGYIRRFLKDNGKTI